MTNTLSLLKNNLIWVVLLYKNPGASFFLSLSDKTKTFSPISSGSLSFLFLLLSFSALNLSPTEVLFYFAQSVKIIKLPKSIVSQTFFLHSFRLNAIFFDWCLIGVFFGSSLNQFVGIYLNFISPIVVFALQEQFF